MKINPGIFIEIKQFCSFYGNVICQILIRFRCISSCDTTSSQFGVGQIILSKKCDVTKMYPLQDMGISAAVFKRLDKAKPFFSNDLCSGKEEEFPASIRKRLYELTRRRISY